MEHIISDPKIMAGKPLVQGTRLTVEFVLEELGAGRSIDDLVRAHPTLSREKVQAALAFAANVLRMDIEFPIAERAG